MNLTDVKLELTDFKEFKPFETVENRLFYENLPSEFKLIILKNGDLYNKMPIPTLLATDYLEYHRDGNRANYEAMHFTKRRQLASMTLAFCVDNNLDYMDKIINLIISICEESGWQFPAHNNYIRDTKPLPFPNVKKPVLDLFALETSALLSTVLYLLKSEFKEKFSFVIERIEYEIKNRVIDPYINEFFWWTGEKSERTLNWTVWCTQNILVTLFFNDFDNESKLVVVNKALKSLQAFLNDYDEDGCCDEGAEYFRHAGLCFFRSVDILNKVTSDKFDFIFEQQKVKNIANFIRNVHVADDYYINFADCSARAGYSGTDEYLFAKKINDANLMNFVLTQHNNTSDVDLLNERDLYMKLQSVITSVEMMKVYSPKNVYYEDIYYRSVGLFVARDNQFTLGVKAGHNDDNHNHNDVGSFTIYKKNIPFIIDVGVERYVAKTFSPQRYEIWTMQSSYHNLPEFDGIMQSDGKDFKATNVDVVFENECSKISMNLENAYPSEAKLNSFKRTVTLHKNRNIEIEDICNGEYHNSILNIMVWKKPLLSDNILTFDNFGKILVENGKNIIFEEIKIEDSRLHNVWGDFIYRIRIEYDNNLKLIIE